MEDKKPTNEDNGLGMCQTCKTNFAEEWHTCPYAEEINNNTTDLCNCCKDCEHECAMDI